VEFDLPAYSVGVSKNDARLIEEVKTWLQYTISNLGFKYFVLQHISDDFSLVYCSWIMFTYELYRFYGMR
jgi:hypothetical protein